MDFLTAALCLCIGNCVAWLLALYTENGAPRLLWNLFLGIAGAFLSALAIQALGLAGGVIWLLAVGPVAALVTIGAGQAGWRAVKGRGDGRGG
jgi:hypothetical protein